MEVRVLYKTDGTIAVIHPCQASRRPQESEVDWLERVFTKSNPENFPFSDVDASELPDREFRNAWRGKKGEKVKVDPKMKNKTQRDRVIESKVKEIKDRNEKAIKDQALAELNL